ncbi:DUF2252 family protein [Azospirillum doebereinerae]
MPSSKSHAVPPDQRQALLAQRRNLKMAQSAHAYVRGSTVKFYEWLEASAAGGKIPDGPPVWICGDCHVGNLGPVANAKGRIGIQIRDVDQTVIGNPAHDLIRLGLSLATAARGSDLPGVTTARMLERMIEGYMMALDEELGGATVAKKPSVVRIGMREAIGRTWKHLARERIKDVRPTIPLGKRFWPLSDEERAAVEELFKRDQVRRLVTALHSRDDNDRIELLDAAYWVKGCSSLGRIRVAVLLGVGDGHYHEGGLSLIDIKEAVQAAAPRAPKAPIPRDNAERVVVGAQNLSPNLGDRMRPARLLEKAVFLRELLPQDIKLDFDHLTREEATRAAFFLAAVVGKAHARQMDEETRKSWRGELGRNRTKSLDAPSWLWSSIVDLIVGHEAAYLEHCRRYAERNDR